MLDTIPGIDVIARACLTASGTTTEIIDSIAWARTAHQSSGWADDTYRRTYADVRDYAAFLYGSYDEYPHDACFDDLKPEHREAFIGSLIANFDLEDDAPPAPIALAGLLLDGLRKAAALRVEYGQHYGVVHHTVRDALMHLLYTQSVSPSLAAQAVDHALTTGKSIQQAITAMDCQL